MPHRKISQHEARGFKARLAALEQRERSRRLDWATDWPGGTDICRAKFDADSRVAVAIRTARTRSWQRLATTGRSTFTRSQRGRRGDDWARTRPLDPDRRRRRADGRPDRLMLGDPPREK